jgi:hypothetical protein
MARNFKKQRSAKNIRLQQAAAGMDWGAFAQAVGTAISSSGNNGNGASSSGSSGSDFASIAQTVAPIILGALSRNNRSSSPSPNNASSSDSTFSLNDAISIVSQAIPPGQSVTIQSAQTG